MSEGEAAPEFSAEEVKQLEELEAKHQRIHPFRIDAPHGLVVLRKPTRPEWRKYKATRDREDGLVDVGKLDEDLIRSCLCKVGTSCDALLDDYPGLVEIFILALENLATGTKDQVRSLGKDWKRPAATT
jgi:hypothetical protein